MTSSTRQKARDLLQTFVAQQVASGAEVALDVWRVLQEEAHLLYETQCVRDLFDQDPFQCHSTQDEGLPPAIQTFQNSLHVSSCHRLEKGDNYGWTEAVVRYCCCSASNNTAVSVPLTKKQKRQHSTHTASDDVQLHFRYERDPATDSTPTSIWYSIDISLGCGPKQNILTIRAWADGDKPSRLPAVSMDDYNGGDIDREDGVMEEDNTDTTEGDASDNDTQDKKNGKTDNLASTSSSKNNLVESNENEKKGFEVGEEESRDRYACFLDPEGLELFQEQTQLTSLDEATAFFTLMTFPFYQHEFDLVAFVLDSVFAGDDDDDDDDEEEEGAGESDGGHSEEHDSS